MFQLRAPGSWWWFVLLAVLLPAFPAYVQSQPLDPARPAGQDTVVIGTRVVFAPGGMDPLFALSEVARSVMSTVFTQDIARDDNWKPFSQGVEYLPSLGDGTWRTDGERMTLVWKIRPRNWHDGRPVTCGDYVFSHQVARDVRVQAAGGGFDEGIATKKIANVACPKGAAGREIIVRWNERWPYANLFVTGYGALPRHILESSFRSSPSRLHDTPYGKDPKATVGDGAYRMVERRTEESLTVESVGTHPIFGTPRIKRIIWRYMPRDALVGSILSGAIDIIGNFGILELQGLELERQAAGRVKVFWVPSLFWEHIDFNLDNPFLQDVRVRRAIAHGINRTQIVQQVFRGKNLVAHTYLPPRHPGFTDAVQQYPYDPARARALLQQAGFAPGPDGIMRNAAGQRLSLELNTTAENPFRVQITQIIQEQLRQVGIEITILNYPARFLFGEITGKRKLKAMVMYAWIFSPTSDCDSLYTSDGIPSEGNGWTGQNFPGYKNPEMDATCKAIGRELDEAKRNELLRQSAQIFSRDLPALPLYFRVSVMAAKVGLMNFAPSGILVAGNDTWNAHQWYWR